ncbi:hypothetical protein Tco_0762708 [Tanacetum coccineum]
MQTSKDDYLITTLRFVSAKEATQIYGAILPECLTSPEMKKSKAYKTYLGYATGASPSKKDCDLVPVDEEPVKKEAPVETKSKRKEKVDVTRGKGIELLSEVALIEEAQMKEGNDEDDSNDDNDPVSEGNDEENESDDDETQSGNEKGSDSKQDTDENESDDDNLESKSNDVIEGDEEKGMDDTTNQFDDDVDVRLNEPTQTDKEVIKHEGVDAEMNDAQQGNENLVITQEQVVEDAHVTILTVAKETKVPVTSTSHSSDLALKFLNFADIPHHDAKIVSPLDVHVHLTSNKESAAQILPAQKYLSSATPVIEKMVEELLKEVPLAQMFEVRLQIRPQDQEGILGNDVDEPRKTTASSRDLSKTRDNDLYIFKEGDFLRLWINDIEDMLLLVVQNRLTNLSGDDVADFAIALRMFTKSLVIQKRVEDLQLGVESYQKQINVIKPDTTRSDLRKKHPYTPYKDP